jgi:hypothetical protein
MELRRTCSAGFSPYPGGPRPPRRTEIRATGTDEAVPLHLLLAWRITSENKDSLPQFVL